MSNTDENRRTDLGRDAASSTLGDDDTGPKPGRIGPAPEAGGAKAAPAPSEGKAGLDNQFAAGETSRAGSKVRVPENFSRLKPCVR